MIGDLHLLGVPHAAACQQLIVDSVWTGSWSVLRLRGPNVKKSLLNLQISFHLTIGVVAGIWHDADLLTA
ncbi:hypothetical protein T07_4953 [Trichinella nelsoni]|uniref:Uncharacterized protein n=1 Tax=Trichinella nelsoni TaxID=6336 RepID=A0A0V0RHR8_9BILA|nr:hypothetical protein T07_4953 [Trichinella nelsoni]